MKSNRNNWLARQIDSARKSLDERPEWMKRAAHFEGSNANSLESVDESLVYTAEQDNSKKVTEK
jgi:hypothetical protein